MALHSLHCADVLLRNCSLTHSLSVCAGVIITLMLAVLVCRQLWSLMEKFLNDVVSTCKYIRDHVSQITQLIRTPLSFG